MLLYGQSWASKLIIWAIFPPQNVFLWLHYTKVFNCMPAIGSKNTNNIVGISEWDLNFLSYPAQVIL